MCSLYNLLRVLCIRVNRPIDCQPKAELLALALVLLNQGAVFALPGKSELIKQYNLAFDRGDYGKALQIARSTDTPAKQDPQFIYMQSKALLEMGQKKQALALIEKAIQLDSGRVAFWEQKVKTTIQFSDFVATQLAINQSIKLGSKDALVWAIKARLEVMAKKWNLAITSANTAIKLDPRDPGPYSSRGIAYIYLNQYDLALHDLNQFIIFEPDCALGYNNRGMLLNKMFRFRDALKDLNKAIELDKNYTSPYNNRSVSYSALGEYKKAIADIEFVIAHGIRTAPNYVNRGLAYRCLKLYDKAEQDFRTAVSIDPKSDAAYIHLAALEKIRKNCSKALESINKAIAINPLNGDAYHTRSEIYLAIGKREECIADLEKAMSMSKNPDIYATHAKLSAQSGYFEQALDDLTAVPLNQSANGEFDFKSYEKLLGLYDKLIQKAPNKVELYYGRALVKLVVNQPGAAAKDLETYLSFPSVQTSKTSFMAVLLEYVTLERLKRFSDLKARVELRRKQLATVDGGDTTIKLLDFLAGKYPNENVESFLNRLANVDSKNAKRLQTQIHCVEAMHLVNLNNKAAAVNLLKIIVDRGDRQQDEYLLAFAEYKRLTGSAH